MYSLDSKQTGLLHHYHQPYEVYKAQEERGLTEETEKYIFKRRYT